MQIDAMTPLLNVEDIERSIDFYSTHLGFQVAQRAESGGATVWAVLQQGPAKLMVNRPGKADSTDRRRRPGYSDLVLYLYVPSARDSHAALQAANVTVSDVTLEPYGVEEFRLRDPDGYELAIVSPTVRIA